MLTSEQFIELVEDCLKAHVSRDQSVVPEDQKWEAENFSRTLSARLRVEGFALPDVPKAQP